MDVLKLFRYLKNKLISNRIVLLIKKKKRRKKKGIERDKKAHEVL
jgi:hypothetical protein